LLSLTKFYITILMAEKPGRLYMIFIYKNFNEVEWPIALFLVHIFESVLFKELIINYKHGIKFVFPFILGYYLKIQLF
jgi:hypothetical protein